MTKLVVAEAVSWRAPYITSAPMRQLANTAKIEFVDMHLSHVAQTVMEGFLGPIDFAIIEATEVTPDGKVYLTTGIGNSPTFLRCADKVIIELNSYHSPRLRELGPYTMHHAMVAYRPPARPGPPLVDLVDALTHAVFGVVNIMMKFAQIGVFGARSVGDCCKRLVDSISDPAKLLKVVPRDGVEPPPYID